MAGDALIGQCMNGKFEINAEGCGVKVIGIPPVSYTHLDVYKRQVVSC